jgi:hypothetical protein
MVCCVLVSIIYQLLTPLEKQTTLTESTNLPSEKCIVARVNYNLCSHAATYIYFCRAASNTQQGPLPCNDTKWPMNRTCRATHCSAECCANFERDITVKITECDQIAQSLNTGSALLDYQTYLRTLDARQRLIAELQSARSQCGQKCRIDSFRAHASSHQYEPGVDDVINADNPYPPSSTPRPAAWLIVSFGGSLWREYPDWPRMRDRLLGRGV